MAKAAIDADLALLEGKFEMRELWRLTLWAVAAAAALTLAVFAGSTEAGRQRMGLVFGQDRNPIKTSQASFAHPLDTKEQRQLAASVRQLMDEREQLRARIASIERSVGSITGSLARVEKAAQAAQAAQAMQAVEAVRASRPATAPAAFEPAPAPEAAQADASPQVIRATEPAPQAQTVSTVEATKAPPAPAPKSAQASASPQVVPATQPTPQPQAVSTVEAAKAPPPAQLADPVTDAPPAHEAHAAQGAGQPEAAGPAADDVTSSITSTEHVPMPPRPPEGAQAERSVSVATGRTQFGLDLGGANSVKDLRQLWKGLRRKHAAQLARLHPVVQPHRQTFLGGTEWRLVAGPLASAAAAARACDAMATAGASCRPAVFQGQRLADR